MKKKIKVQEVDEEGFLALLGKPVLVFCARYIYAGNLEGVNDDCIKLDDPKIVYETGAFTEKTHGDAQSLPNSLYIQKDAIESFHETNKA